MNPRSPFARLLVLGAVLAATSSLAAQEADPAAEVARVYVLPIETDLIDEETADFVDRAVDQATRQKGQVLLVEIDTPGGRTDSMARIVTRIDDAADDGLRTVAFVLDQAISAGSLITISCREVYMRPGSTIGAAAPRDALGRLIEDEKVISILRTEFESWAEKQGRPAKLMMAMVDKSMEVWEVEVEGEEKRHYLTPEEIYRDYGIRSELFQQIRNFPDTVRKLVEEGTPPQHFYQREPYEHEGRAVRIVRPMTVPGKILTLTAEQAVHAGLADGILPDRAAVLAKLGAGEARVVELEPTWAENVVGFLAHPLVTFILVMIAILGIGIELYVPGFGAPGIVGLLALAAVFTVHWLTGVAGVLDLILIVLGLVLIAVEIFVLPGFGVAGISGILLFLGGLVLALQDFTVPRDAVEMQLVVRNLFYVLATIAGAVILLFASLRYLPETRAFQAFALEADMKAEDGYTVARPERAALVGRRGRATSPLRPAGKAIVGDDLLDVVTRGEWIESGTEVEVVDVRGNRILVQVVEPGGEAV